MAWAEERKLQFSLSRMGSRNPMYGKKQPEKVKQFLSKTRMGNQNPAYGTKLSADRIEQITIFMRNNHPRKGVHLTEETKKKISESNKGNGKGIPKPKTKEQIEKQRQTLLRKYATGEIVISEEARRKMSENRLGEKNGHYGKKHSEEVKRKISETRKENFASGKIIPTWLGKTLPIEIVNKMKQRCGPLASNWKGGISIEPYCHIWTDAEYKRDIMERDSFQCQNPLCNNKFDKLYLHHINYNKKDCSPLNLITLCNSCNSRANFNRGYWKILYSIKNTNFPYSVRA